MSPSRVVTLSSFFLFCFSLLNAQSLDFFLHPPDTMFLQVRSPGRDTVMMTGNRLRYSGRTTALARAFINGVETKVWPTGAFAGLSRTTGDTSTVQMTVVGPNGDSLSQTFVCILRDRPKPLPHDTLVIDRAMMEPSEDLWLMPGDVVNVQFRGSPGWQGSFSIPDVESGIPMREIPPDDSNDPGGIYVGQYVVKPEDRAEGVQVEFRLKRSFFSREHATSRARLWIMPDSLPRTVEVVGRRPFLNVGLGTDRLGGAKLGFLQPGVLLQLTGRVGRQYRVRLSEAMEAWLPAEYGKLLPLDTPRPESLVGSIGANGTDSGDVVFVGLSKRLPYISDQQTDPMSIVVDVYGATSNTNWVTHQRSAKGIESVKWNQVAADQYRLTIALRSRQHWGYDIDYVGSSLRIRVRRPPVVTDTASPVRGLRIALDAGHGGSNSGATGTTGVREMDLNLAMVQLLDSVLTARGAMTTLTRTDDGEKSMTERTDVVLDSGSRVLISIHCNATGDGGDPNLAKGTSTYYRYIGYKTLAEMMYTRMLELGLEERGVTGSFNFSLNGPTQLPNVLVETAFLSNPEDEYHLLTPDFRRGIAVKVANGLEEFVRTYGVPAAPMAGPK